MKKILTILLISGLCLTGCGGISQKEFDSIAAEKGKLQKEYDELQKEYDELQEEYGELQEGHDKLEERYGKLEKRYDDLLNLYRSQGASNADNEKEEQTTETEAETEDDSEIPVLYYSSGHYKVGTDMEPGEYVLLAEGDRGGFFSVDSDANGREIIFNGSFDTNSIVTVNEHEFLELRRCTAVKYDDFYRSNSIGTDLEGIMIKVGDEIEEGEYRIEGADGFYCIYKSSRHPDMVTCGSIKGSRYINVENGQYLELRRCKISEKTE